MIETQNPNPIKSAPLLGPELLQHDKVLSKAPPAPHVKMVPAYLRVSGPNGPPLFPPRGQKSAVGYLAKRRIGQKKGGGMGLDPLKTFSLKVTFAIGGDGGLIFAMKVSTV